MEGRKEKKEEPTFGKKNGVRKRRKNGREEGREIEEWKEGKGVRKRRK